MLEELLDLREAVSLSLTRRVLQWKDYKSNNDIKKLERKLREAVIKKEVKAKRYLLPAFFDFLYIHFYIFPKGHRIRMTKADITELYKKWGFHDLYFNPETARSESAPVLSKVPWLAPDNAFAELVSVLWKQG
jgi:hypothetical protein